MAERYVKDLLGRITIVETEILLNVWSDWINQSTVSANLLWERNFNVGGIALTIPLEMTSYVNHIVDINFLKTKLMGNFQVELKSRYQYW